ncbi:hypothetical protein PSEUDO8Z_170176 [Pseudomonas sp. 8Z]|nr:hypothetical protein PSEUDO8Z_170176 [Pseudomonas sp. 8Z]
MLWQTLSIIAQLSSPATKSEEAPHWDYAQKNAELSQANLERP